MKIIIQLGGLFLLCLTCETIADFLPFAFPAGVLSMLLLFALFLLRVIQPESLQETSDFLLKNMAFFFVPAGVGIIKYYNVLASVLWQFLLICVVSTIVTFAATAYTIRLVTALQNRCRKKGDCHE